MDIWTQEQLPRVWNCLIKIHNSRECLQMSKKIWKWYRIIVTGRTISMWLSGLIDIPLSSRDARTDCSDPFSFSKHEIKEDISGQTNLAPRDKTCELQWLGRLQLSAHQFGGFKTSPTITCCCGVGESTAWWHPSCLMLFSCVCGKHHTGAGHSKLDEKLSTRKKKWNHVPVAFVLQQSLSVHLCRISKTCFFVKAVFFFFFQGLPAKRDFIRCSRHCFWYCLFSAL